MPGRSRYIIIASITGAASNASVPFVSLVTLQPYDYGLFSYLYLVFAWGASMAMSVVCESAVRSIQSALYPSAWALYSRALAQLSAIFALGCFALGFALRLPVVSSVLFAIAVLLSIYRFGARYHAVYSGRWHATVVSDTLLLSTFGVVFLIAPSVFSELDSLAVAWITSSACGGLVAGYPSLIGRGGLIRWIRAHSTDVRTLVADSLIMDLGALGSAAFVAALVTPPQFGLYRGVSNVSMPVRIIFGTFRPLIGSRRIDALMTRRLTRAVVATSVGLGLVVIVLLRGVIPVLGSHLGTLGQLPKFAIHCGIFVAVSCIAQYFYGVCRNHAAPKSLILVQIIQTAAMLSLPFVGWIVLGLAGAISGYVASAALGAAGWMVVARSSTSRYAGTNRVLP